MDGRPAGSRRCRASPARSISIRSGRPTERACTSCPIRDGITERLPRAAGGRRAAPGDEPVHRRQRHHRDQSGDQRGRSEAAGWPTACSAPTGTRSTPWTRAEVAGRDAGRRCRRRPWRPRLLPPVSRESAALASAAERPADRAARRTPTSRRALQGRALAHRRGPAVARRRIERVRDLRRRRRVALLERRAGQPQPDHRPAGERRSQGHHRAGGLPEHGPPPQLGRRRSSRCPISPAASRRGPSTINGEPAVRRAGAAQRQTNRDLQALHRLSLQHRAAGRALRRRTATSRSTTSSGPRRFVRSPASRCWTRRRTCRPAARSNLGLASAALVYDNSFFGATGPILGQRYRLRGHARRSARSTSSARWPTTAGTSCRCAPSRWPPG